MGTKKEDPIPIPYPGPKWYPGSWGTCRKCAEKNRKTEKNTKVS